MSNIILLVSNDWSINIANGLVVDVVFVYHGKAFDTSDHSVYQWKLHMAGTLAGLFD